MLSRSTCFPFPQVILCPDQVIQNQRNSSGDSRSGSGSERFNTGPVRLFLQRGNKALLVYLVAMRQRLLIVIKCCNQLTLILVCSFVSLIVLCIINARFYQLGLNPRIAIPRSEDILRVVLGLRFGVLSTYSNLGITNLGITNLGLFRLDF